MPSGRHSSHPHPLDQFVRPIALRLAGPVIGGALVAISAGVAFAVDAASFAATLVAVLAIRTQRHIERDVTESTRAAIAPIRSARMNFRR